MRWFVWLFALCGTCVALARPAWALAPPPLQGHVNDLAALLSASQREQLEQRLTRFEQQTGRQFALLTIPSLEGDSLEDFSIRVVEAWKLGKKGKDDGLLLLVVQRDRKVRIEVGYGLEGEVTDAVSARTIREQIQPAFRAGQYAAGINAGFARLIRAAGGSTEGDTPAEPARSARGRARSPLGGMLLLLIVLPLIFFLRSRAARRQRPRSV